MKLKKICLFIVAFCFLMHLDAEEENRSSLVYVKGGGMLFPGSKEAFYPEVGLGVRFQKGHYGFDLSASCAFIPVRAFTNATVKGLFLMYPYPEKKNQLYWGFGPGVSYFNYVDVFSLTAEGVIGYEFRHSEHLKTFVQLELSEALFYSKRGGSHTPGVAITAGIGF